VIVKRRPEDGQAPEWGHAGWSSASSPATVHAEEPGDPAAEVRAGMQAREVAVDIVSDGCIARAAQGLDSAQVQALAEEVLEARLYGPRVALFMPGLWARTLWPGLATVLPDVTPNDSALAAPSRGSSTPWTTGARRRTLPPELDSSATNTVPQGR
jgi:hypothetical protein